jgi:hypothetical protein
MPEDRGTSGAVRAPATLEEVAAPLPVRTQITDVAVASAATISEFVQ